MTEYSYFWEDTTLGDASLAPYDDSEVAEYLVDAHGARSKYGYIVQDYFNFNFSGLPSVGTYENFDYIQSTNWYVNYGVAYIKGQYYKLLTPYIPLFAANASGNPRYDGVGIEVDSVTQTARIVVVTGTPAATPAEPTSSDTFLLLYSVYIPNGFAGGQRSSTFVHDKRVFRYTGFSANKYDGNDYMHNVGFMAHSNPTAAIAPEYWTTVGTVSSIAIDDLSTWYAPQRQGQGLTITSGAGGGGIQTYVPIPNSSETGYRTFTLSFWYALGTETILTVTIQPKTLGGGTGTAITKTINVNTVNTTPALNSGLYSVRINVSDDYDALYVSIYGSTNTGTFTLGQVSLFNGFVVPDYLPNKNEIIFFRYRVPVTGWSGYAAKSSGTTVVTDAPYILTGTRGVFTSAIARDSGSAGSATASLKMYHAYITSIGVRTPMYSGTFLARATNDQVKETLGILPVPSSKFSVTATGAGTLDVDVNFIGIIT